MSTKMQLERLSLLAASVLFLSACELVVDFDRSLIVDASADAVAVDADTPDGGPDATDPDGGPDAGPDGGPDAGPDGGPDAGPDGGPDAGPDGGPDAGPDGGPDAGPPECTMPSECDDAVTCTMDDCTDMSCVQTPMDSLCDDANICTVNTCDAVADCQATSCSLAIDTPAFPELSTIIRLASVDGGEGGLLAVVFDDNAGAPNVPLGALTISAGASMDLDIELSRPVANDEVIYVQLFEDMGTVGTYDDGVDVAAQDAMAMDVIDSVTVALAAGLPDFEVVTSGAVPDYNFSMARPSTITISGADPELVLIRGGRYRIRNVLPLDHPFEFIITGTPDIVQLAQGAGTTGDAEGEASIAWDESDSQDILFTVSTEFEAAVDSYRCRIHTASMRGTVSYIDAP